MDLSTTQQIILVVLAAALSVFIVLAIVVAILVIRLLMTVKLITTKAERLIQTAEAAAEVFKRASGPVGIFNVIKNIVETVHHHKRNNKE